MKSEVKVKQTPFILRAIWFVLIGWELTAAWIAIAWFLNLTVVLMPLGVWMLNRVPQVLTLKSMGGAFAVDAEGNTLGYEPPAQIAWPLRAIYFLVFGWWLSIFWAFFGYLLCVTIVLLPVGLVMLNNLPFVTTLHR